MNGTTSDSNKLGDSLSLESTAQEAWRGKCMHEIYREQNPFELSHTAPVRPCKEHTVLYNFPITGPANVPPRPLQAHLKWDAFHVRLPCSPKSQYPVTDETGSSRIESRWEMIEQALLRPINNSQELQTAILSYNTKYASQWNFRALHRLFEEEIDECESNIFFQDLLPRIIRLALRLPELIQAPIPLLKQGQNHSISLTQQQVSCLLANAFLCTFPRRNTMKRKSEYSSFPDINFNRLYQSNGDAVLEKIKCICHYFRRVCPTEQSNSNVPCGVVTFTRRSVLPSELPSWTECNELIGAVPLHITSAGTIEDQGLGLLQVDFANKYLGGGVLGSGCVQEEIRFVICPELLISKLFTECLKPTEALLMVGCERYSNYNGYAHSFQWDGNHVDETPIDVSRRRLTHIVAIDALRFVQPAHQYREDLMLRELNKAYVGFVHELSTPAPGIASGNWGCGAFGGDSKLKALLQLMVCAVAQKPLVYFTFGDDGLRNEVFELYCFLQKKEVTVHQLWSILKSYQGKQVGCIDLYKFIRDQIEHRPTRSLLQTLKHHFTNVLHESTKSIDKAKSPIGSAKNIPALMTTINSPDVFADTDSQDESATYQREQSNEVVSDESQNVTTIDVSSYNPTDSKSSIGNIIDDVDEANLQNISERDKLEKKDGCNSKKLQTAKIKEMRQRSLLEMLDADYSRGIAPPPSKYHCSGI